MQTLAYGLLVAYGFFGLNLPGSISRAAVPSCLVLFPPRLGVGVGCERSWRAAGGGICLSFTSVLVFEREVNSKDTIGWLAELAELLKCWTVSLAVRRLFGGCRTGHCASEGLPASASTKVRCASGGLFGSTSCATGGLGSGLS